MQWDKVTLVACGLGTPTSAVNVGSLWQATNKTHLQQLVHLPASASLLTWRVSQPTLTNLPYAKLHTLLLNHLAAVPVDGRVSAWGWDGCGQLGTGGTASACQPKHVIVPLCTHVSAESGFSSAVAKSS